ncbi:NUDIX domain-containing protein [Sphingomonas phyllosphaerae]|uniref:NUDIX domain-containing protein n=1 Tax=Sphingomonas phyllosphaerae TaxID=257003 RepID=UPI000402BD9A|nr:NUDIX domain-containing protein [Sphingomonas phyllosphaerae]
MLRLILPLAYRVRRCAMALLRWRTRGVKLLVFDRDGRVLLARHRYGRSDLHMLPGGGIARAETPETAAARELREETGCIARGLRIVARYESRTEGRRDTVFLFTAQTDDTPVPDGRELAEAAFHPLGDLPATLSPATRRRIEEWNGARERSKDW